MAKKITPEIAIAMAACYKKLGTYAAVAKEFGVSSSTASRYIKEQGTIRTYNEYCGPAPSDGPRNMFSFSHLTDNEAASLEQWYKEFNL